MLKSQENVKRSSRWMGASYERYQLGNISSPCANLLDAKFSRTSGFCNFLQSMGRWEFFAKLQSLWKSIDLLSPTCRLWRTAEKIVNRIRWTEGHTVEANWTLCPHGERIFSVSNGAALPVLYIKAFVY